MNKIIIENLSLQYSDGTESLRGINLNVPEKALTVLFGPAGGGKSTLLRCINRLNDLTEVVEEKDYFAIQNLKFFGDTSSFAFLPHRIIGT